jgi:hypothetical protein
MTIQTSDIGKDAYNKYSSLADFSYNCVSYLLENNEMVWKLLKYTSPDAWNKSNLSHVEKAELVYAGQQDASGSRVFLDIGQPDVFTEEICVLRISPVSVVPKNRTIGLVSMMFEVYAHYKINHLSNYQTRIDLICQNLLDVFNGVEMGGIGKMFFDGVRSTDNKLTQGGVTPFRGKRLVMTTNVGG